MKITIETIPHNEHRYTTVGDWYYEPNGDVTIKVYQLSDPKREMLVAVHELIEVLTCAYEGVTQEMVDQFDMHVFSYEEHPNEEPGDSPTAPYKSQHCLATGIERILAARWGVDWKTYEDELKSLPEVESK